MWEVLDVVLRGKDGGTVSSDDHHAYRRSINRMAGQVINQVITGKDHRGRNNRLWEVNLLDLLTRHCGANRKRETIAWSKRRQASAERLAILLTRRN